MFFSTLFVFLLWGASVSLTLAVIQIPVVTGDVEHNLDVARMQMVHAKEQGATLCILPEVWMTGFGGLAHLTPADSDKIKEAVSELAAEMEMVLVGSQPVYMEGAWYNAQCVFDETGALCAQYEKLHLFSLLDEHKRFSPGNRFVTVDTRWGRFGLAICYDLRFPELFRHLALADVSCVLLSAAFPHPRLMHWQTLLTARAIENQYFVVASNQCSNETIAQHAVQFFGHSMVIDPWGEVVTSAGEQPACLVATLDFTQVDKVRHQLTALADRRTDMYG